ncbi:hypothetical protein QBC39DRAFT_19430 [Podospora conica]|nr:hypothetical protein QBC39DRAFT_19430 [Schizothecium conicum]
MMSQFILHRPCQPPLSFSFLFSFLFIIGVHRSLGSPPPSHLTYSHPYVHTQPRCSAHLHLRHELERRRGVSCFSSSTKRGGWIRAGGFSVFEGGDLGSWRRRRFASALLRAWGGWGGDAFWPVYIRPNTREAIPLATTCTSLRP